MFASAACRLCQRAAAASPTGLPPSLQSLPRPFTKLRNLDMSALAAAVAADLK